MTYRITRTRAIFISLWLTSLFCFSVFCYALGKKVTERNYEAAIIEATEDVANGCPKLFGYASMLEDENAKINRLLRECKDGNQ